MDRASTSSAIESAQATADNADSNQELAIDEDECVNDMELPIYKAATTGDTDGLSVYGERLSQMLTPTRNTVLHIYIACALPNGSANVATVENILVMCPTLLFQSNKRRETALHMAARHGHDDIVQHLIDAAKARDDPEEACWPMLMRTTNSDKDTALHEAVRFNHLAVVHILTREDRQFLYSANAAGESPLYMAVERGNHDLVSKILETCTHPTYDGPNGRTALHAAVIFKDEQMTSKLLDRCSTDGRALTKAVDKQGWTPLHYAAFFGHASIVKQLLESDESAAYIRDKNDNKTALHLAAFRGHLDAMQELISRCPGCCELVDKRHRNILHYAIENRKFQVQDFVLKDPWLSNVLLNGKDEDQNTPFHQLASSFHKYRYLNGAGPAIMISSSDLICDARVDKMAFNKKNLNPSDIIQSNDTFSIREKSYLKRLSLMNGGRPGHRIVSYEEIAGEDTNIRGVKEAQGSDVMNELKQAHLIAAALIATVTFTAGMTMPGGYQSEKGPDQGLAALAKQFPFRLFAISNTMAMILSSYSVFLHFILVLIKPRHRRASKMLDWVLSLILCAFGFMLIAFICGTYAVLGYDEGLIVIGVAFCFSPLAIFFLRSNTAYIIQSLRYINFSGDPAHFEKPFTLSAARSSSTRGNQTEGDSPSELSGRI